MAEKPYDDVIEPIDDTPENVVRAISQGPPKKNWRFTEGRGDARRKKPKGAAGEVEDVQT